MRKQSVAGLLSLIEACEGGYTTVILHGECCSTSFTQLQSTHCITTAHSREAMLQSGCH